MVVRGASAWVWGGGVCNRESCVARVQSVIRGYVCYSEKGGYDCEGEVGLCRRVRSVAKKDSENCGED